MTRTTRTLDNSIENLLDRIKIPTYVPATPEERAKRRKYAMLALQIRDEIGPIDIRIDELLHLAERESEL